MPAEPALLAAAAPREPGGQREIARFLASRAPFDALSSEELHEVAARIEVEFHLPRASILTEDGGPVTFLRVVLSGGVELVHDEVVLDVLGPGDSFGHSAMLAGLPPGFEARATEDTLCYRLPVEVARPLLELAGQRDLGLGSPETGHQPVARLIRSPTLQCAPSDPVAEVARRMTELGAGAAVVRLGGGELGIVTDRDLRSRVLAVGASAETPVSAVMTRPVFCVEPDRLAGEVLFDLLERGIRRAPVVSSRGALVGIVEDSDLLAADSRSWFGVRRAIARVRDVDELSPLMPRVIEAVGALHASGARASAVARVLSALLDAVSVRAVELVTANVPLPPDGLLWLAVGAHARRELTPASPVGGALLCEAGSPPSWLSAVGRALTGLGLRGEVGAWAAGSPAPPLPSELVADRRVLWGTPREPLPSACADPSRLGELRRRALVLRPPTGFAGSDLLESDGRASPRLDIDRVALEPIARLAAWAAAEAGMPDGSTAERLQAAASAGLLAGEEARTLAETFELALDVLLRHQFDRLGAGCAPEEPVACSALSRLERDGLRSAFRAIAAAQQALVA